MKKVPKALRAGKAKRIPAKGPLDHRPLVTVRKKQTAPVQTVNVDFAAAVLKGIIEHRDASTYFGSTGALNTWLGVAREKGWILEADEVTAAGRKHYAESGLEKLPKTPNRRAYFWDWSVYSPPSQ